MFRLKVKELIDKLQGYDLRRYIATQFGEDYFLIKPSDFKTNKHFGVVISLNEKINLDDPNNENDLMTIGKIIKLLKNSKREDKINVVRYQDLFELEIDDIEDMNNPGTSTAPSLMVII